ncbi:hypothetical protein E2C01_078118 [Portunus trituberculatus]|uniref:Uncharacterized protein n=1 Tax=Portunus trituberculatus TaxID=210409 RepID=A0A5B7IN09_PORTR|nr:hypothetical protein [Portunus trituberculatus]
MTESGGMVVKTETVVPWLSFEVWDDSPPPSECLTRGVGQSGRRDAGRASKQDEEWWS